MPYIKIDQRGIFDYSLNQVGTQIESKGELTYCLYKLCCIFMDSRKISYENLSIVTSCLEDAKLEFYRRKIAPYEDQKIIENGDI